MVRPTAVEVHGVNGGHRPARTGKHGQVNANLAVQVRIKQPKVDDGTTAVCVGCDWVRVAVKDGPEQFGSRWKFGLNGDVGPSAFFDVVDATVPSDGRRRPFRHQRRSQADVVDEPIIAACART